MILRKLPWIAFVLLALPSLAHAQCISSGGDVACVIPGAILSGTGASQVLTLTGGITIPASLLVGSVKTTGSIVIESYAAPTSCTGDGCALATGSLNAVGKISVTTTGASAPVIVFSTTYAHAPACFSNNETTANLSRAISTTTQVTISGVTVASDVIKYTCMGF